MDGTMRHELRADDAHHHHYLICRSCHKVEPVDDCVVGRLEEELAAKRGYTAIGHSLQLTGVCPRCQKSGSKAKKKGTLTDAMFGFFSSRLGCLGSIAVSILGTVVIVLLERSCSH